MATLVLSTVGTMLGGPIGGALGALAGQAIDQALFGPPPRRGPRLGDLRVQTSSYGSPIPRIHGRMRVAGTVVWATDLKEEEGTSGGAKGSPGAIVYSYSASFAVALSSRRAGAIGRVWADGKLLRGDDGALKARGSMRFYPGDERQPLDPLIASIEGGDGSPAFRGLALAVFEDLALADFGNRIPSLSFEVIADAEAPTVAEVIADIGGGLIERSTESARVHGYAALGSDRRSAAGPLIALWGGDYHDDGAMVRAGIGDAPAIAIDAAALGCAADDDGAAARIERAQESAAALPTAVAIDYYDRARDYQAGQMRASMAAGGRNIARVDSAAALDAEAAKALAGAALARRWAGRDRITLRLSPDYLSLRPGERIAVPGVSGDYRIEQVTIEAMTVIVVARRRPSAAGEVAAVPADPGRAVVAVDATVGASDPLLLDLPDVGAGTAFGVQLALGSSGGFRATPVDIFANGQWLTRVTVARAAVTGSVIGTLGAGEALINERQRMVEVQCSDPAALLFHADDAALAMGANAMMIGRELVQFARAVPLGAGRYRLSGLLRGRRGSEHAMAAHAPSERFVLLDPATIHAIALDPAMLGATIEARALGIGDDPASPPSATIVAEGEALRPIAPAHVSAKVTAAGLAISWIARRAAAFAWSDGSDPDVDGATFELTIARGAATSMRTVNGASASVSAAELAALGSGPTTITLVEVGMHGRSHPTRITI